MAHFYPNVRLSDIDEVQLGGYLQHVNSIVKMEAGGVASLLAQMMKR